MKIIIYKSDVFNFDTFLEMTNPLEAGELIIDLKHTNIQISEEEVGKSILERLRQEIMYFCVDDKYIFDIDHRIECLKFWEKKEKEEKKAKEKVKTNKKEKKHADHI